MPAVRVPLVISRPVIPANERSAALLYLFDLLPTLGGMCGVAGPEGSEGLDLGGCVRDPTKPGREHLVFAYRDVQRAVSDARWKLIRYLQVDRTQLFDLRTIRMRRGISPTGRSMPRRSPN